MQRLFREEIEWQCRFVLMAADQLEQARTTLVETATEREAEWNQIGREVFGEYMRHAWFALQSVLVSAANVSKLLWGSRGKRSAERQALRDSLGVADSSPLRDPDLRNDFEHFDERLEEMYGGEDGRSIYAGRNIGSMDHLIVPAMNVKQFGHYDPPSGVVTFWDHSFSVPKILAETQRIVDTIENGGTRPPAESA
jgi:hypothetical protein